MQGILDWLKMFWNDSVWSKVISAIIIAVGTYLLQFWSLRRGGKIVVAPSVAFIDSWITEGDPSLKLTYPIKCHVEMVNESPMSVEVTLAEFVPSTVTLKKFVADTLQVKFFKQWHPHPDGADRVAVLPHQHFIAWVGIDEKKYTMAQVQALKGKIGTFVFKVNGDRRTVDV